MKKATIDESRRRPECVKVEGRSGPARIVPGYNAVFAKAEKILYAGRGLGFFRAFVSGKDLLGRARHCGALKRICT